MQELVADTPGQDLGLPVIEGDPGAVVGPGIAVKSLWNRPVRICAGGRLVKFMGERHDLDLSTEMRPPSKLDVHLTALGVTPRASLSVAPMSEAFSNL